MVTHLVGQHVSLSKIPRCSESLFQFVIETQIDVDLFVCGTVERAGCSLGKAARGIDCVSKENQLGFSILHALSRQELGPRILSIVEYERYELHLRFFSLIIHRVGSRRRLWRPAAGCRQREKVSLEHHAQDEQDEHASET